MKKVIIILGSIFLILAILGVNLPGKQNTVTINNAAFKVRLVHAPEELRKGLGGQNQIPQDEGMLFILGKPGYNSFWMKGMKFPLDIIFILHDKVVGVYENLQPADPTDTNPPIWGGELLSDSVLEINAGLTKKYNIMVGDKVNFNIVKEK